MADDDPTTFEEFFEFHEAIVEREEEDFPGEVPDRGISAIIKAAQGFDEIVMRSAIFDANEEIDEDQYDDVDEALEEQAVDMLAAIGTLQSEYDLDVAAAAEQRMAKTRAIEAAESIEELQEALDEAGVEMDLVDVGGVEVADDVTRDDYEPDDPDRGIQ